MKKKVILIVLMTVSLKMAAEVTVTRQRLAIDTVQAIDLINQDISNKNRLIQQNISDLESEVRTMQREIDAQDRKFRQLEYLESVAGYKTKDKNNIAAMADLLPEIYRVSPMQTLFEKLTKPKDYDKARKKGELQKLLDKEWAKFSKNVAKGDFTHPFLKESIVRFKNDASLTLKKQKSLQRITEQKLNETRNKIIPKINKFDADDFIEQFGTRSLPTHLISEKVSYADPQMAEDYNTLVKRYYNKPEKYTSFKNSLQITGKFDGYIEDTLGMFPLESSVYTPGKEEYYPEDSKMYNKILIKSKNNTVPPLIIDRREFNDIYFTDSPEWILEYHGMECINEIWDKESKPQDGIDLSLHPDGATINMEYTYVYERGEWKHKAPFSPKYRSYDELKRYAKYMTDPITFTYQGLDLFTDPSTAYIIALTCKDMGAKYLPEEGLRVYFKSKESDINGEQEEFGGCDFSIPNENLLGISFANNLTKRGDAIIAFYADIKDGKYKGARMEIYQMDADCFDCLSVYNGIITGEKMGKVAEGYLRKGYGQWELKFPEFEEGDGYQYPDVAEVLRERIPAESFIKSYRETIKKKYGVDIITR